MQDYRAATSVKFFASWCYLMYFLHFILISGISFVLQLKFQCFFFSWSDSSSSIYTSPGRSTDWRSFISVSWLPLSIYNLNYPSPRSITNIVCSLYCFCRSLNYTSFSCSNDVCELETLTLSLSDLLSIPSISCLFWILLPLAYLWANEQVLYLVGMWSTDQSLAPTYLCAWSTRSTSPEKLSPSPPLWHCL